MYRINNVIIVVIIIIIIIIIKSIHIIGIELDDPGFDLDRNRRSFSCATRADRIWGPPSPLFITCWGSSSGVKRPVHTVDHSFPSRTRFKKEWSHTSAPPIRLHNPKRG
jgi:hypothetical protein